MTDRTGANHPAIPSAATPRSAWPWILTVAGLAVGISDALLLRSLGIGFAINGHDATLWVGFYFGASFALLGFLLGRLVEARRRDAHAATVIRQQIEALAATRTRLAHSEKLAALGQLAATIAHEVRNPLGVIRSAAQGMQETASGTTTERACSFIIAETDRLNNVISSLLGFARPLQLAPRAVDINELFDRTLLLAANELNARHVRVERALPPPLPLIYGDPDLVSQALLGLLGNAAEAAEGGRIALAARHHDGRVEIDVTDSGPGVPPELRERIFEPFFTTRTRGTGLGLAIVRQIVEAHAGQVSVDAGPDGGARFTIRLPIASAKAIAA